MSEIWKAVPGFEGAYEVSDQGRVRSLDRVVTVSPNRWGGVSRKSIRGRVLVPGPHQGGYQSVNLYAEGAQHSTTVHILVAAAFLGPRPEGHEVCHKDGDHQNSALTNLRYGTPVSNNQDKRRHGTHLQGDEHPTAKLNTRQVLEIRRARGVPQEVLAERYGVTLSNISAVQLRKSWRHV
jgi:DNA-binding transcriptional regulator YiaG